jgi:hypothetical protein
MRSLGYLFFLGPGILWAFKKPILFLPFHNIVSISYTSVLQRTFNLAVVAREQRSSAEIEIEFGMVDQDDFAGIDAYVKRHGLHDASLAQSRRAKIYNVNAPRGAAAAAAAVGGGAEEPVPEANGAKEHIPGETELQKAERMLQDQEDEMEEDYVDDEEDEDGSSEDEAYSEGEEYDEGDGEAEDYGEEGDFEEEQEYDEEAGGYEDEG